ncbi:MAG TPA: hypothetical protein VFE21_05560 [Rubrobacteraceae bacterium]|nr:hypothetical protein [Rubrobacteraceae bacterium]
MGERATSENLSVIESGSLTAELLENACESALEFGDSLQLEVVRDLAADLKSSLEAMSLPDYRDVPAPELLVEAALHCADLANLAVCNVPYLPKDHRPQAIAAVHLAAGVTRALGALAGEASGSETPHADNILRDTRSAEWRVDLAVRQAEELVEPGKSG